MEIEVLEESDVGRLYLEHEFMGMVVNLLTGDDGRFSIEIDTALGTFVKECDTVCDLSAMLKQMLGSLSDITVVERFPDDVVGE